MDNNIFPDSRYITDLENLFDKNIYNKIILKKYTKKTPPDLIFETKTNKETKFIIKFISNTKIEITVPIKYKNYLYTTSFIIKERSRALNIIYNYLNYHIWIHQ